MASRKSFFNPTLYVKNLLRFWPCWAVTLLLGVMLLPVNLARELSFDLSRGRIIDLSDVAAFTTGLSYVVLISAFVLGILTAVVLSRYLFTARSANFFHTLPIRREGLLLTNTVAGLTMLWAPILLTALITMFVELSFGVFEPSSLGQLLLLYLGASLLFFGIGMLCCQLTGMTVAAIGLYVAVNFVIIVLFYVFGSILSLFLLGFSLSGVPRWVYNLTPLVNLFQCCERSYAFTSNDELIRQLSRMDLPLIYGAVGTALLGVSLLLCRVRPTERAGDLLSFGWLRPVFKLVCSIGAGVTLSVLTLGLYGIDEPRFPILLLLTLVWSLVAYLIAEMLVRKSVKVFQRGVFLRWLASATLILLLFVVMRLDVFGFEHRVPDADRVENVQVELIGRYADVAPEDAVALHAALLEYDDLLREDNSDTSRVRFTYELTNGTTMVRQYDVPGRTNTVRELALPQKLLYDFVTDPETVLLLAFDGALTEDRELKELNVEYYNAEESTYYTIDLNHAQSWQVYRAIEEDIRAGRFHYGEDICYDDRPDSMEPRVNISMQYLHRWEEAPVENPYAPGAMALHWFGLDVHEKMTSTIAILREYGLPVS